VRIGTPEQMANELKPYIDAGFTGFTFNNTIYHTTDQIAVLGELIRIIEGAPAPA
jgi:alkanesulfonate monooxygenase SsuD/methylene tetrahydromethanopterin reductase-like flavin-dependent oxidoreductase (luciferase family)